MAAPNINQRLKVLANQFSPIIQRRIVNTGPWINLTNRDVWPDESGDVISELIYQRAFPNAKPHWANFRGAATENQTGTTCIIPTQTIDFQHTERQYGLQRTALQSPKFCVEDLRFAWKRKNQLDAIQSLLAFNTKHLWEERNRDEYVRVCANKLIATHNPSLLPGFAEEADVPDFATDTNGADLLGAAFPHANATSILTQSILDKIRMRMIREGAGVNPTSMSEGTPVFTLVCSSETSEAILTRNPELRSDLRYAKPSELLSPLGVERSFKGFFHVIDDLAPRFTRNSNTGVYTMVRAYERNDDDIWVLNPAYEDADYEMSIVYHTEVCTTLIPKPISSPGGGQTFDPVNYSGDFKWVNIKNEETNPDGTIGYFRGILASGTKAVRPEFGYAIIHLRGSRVELQNKAGTITIS